MSSFIISVDEARVVGYVENSEAASDKADGNLIVESASNLEGLSNAQLTNLYNGLTGENRGIFKAAKTDNAQKVFEALMAKDLADLVQLDKAEETKVDEQSQNLETQETPPPEAPPVVEQSQVAEQPPVANGDAPKVRKVRDSKLQRMKACFLEQDENGEYKTWTVKELMERCGKPNDPMTERIAHVYISILRSPTDRFVMPISKDKEKGTFKYTPDQPTQ